MKTLLFALLLATAPVTAWSQDRIPGASGTLGLFIEGSIAIRSYNIQIPLWAMGMGTYCDLADDLDNILGDIDDAIASNDFLSPSGWTRLNQQGVADLRQFKSTIRRMFRAANRRC